MITVETAADIYLDVNLLLIAASLLWIGLRWFLRPLGLNAAYTSQLSVLKALLLASLLIPIIHRIFRSVAESYAVPGNLSDLMVTYFVRGNLDMSAGALEQILVLRQNLTSAITAPENTWGTALLYGVIIYAAWLGIRAILAVSKVRQVLSRSHHWRQFGSLELRVSDTVRVPFSTRTLTRQIIVIPAPMIPRSTDLRIAMSHELQHLRHRDVDWEIAAELLKGLFFWNPAYYFMRSQLNELRELSCDQQVLRRTGVAPAAYCESLLRVCANRFETPSVFELQTPTVPLVEIRKLPFRRDPAVQLWTRIDAALETATSKQPRWKVMTVGGLMVSACLLTSYVAGKPKDWTQDRLMLSTIVNLDRLEQRNTFGVRNY